MVFIGQKRFHINYVRGLSFRYVRGKSSCKYRPPKPLYDFSFLGVGVRHTIASISSKKGAQWHQYTWKGKHFVVNNAKFTLQEIDSPQNSGLYVNELVANIVSLKVKNFIG